jgi:hypothetical protein
MSDKVRFSSKTGAYVVGREPNFVQMLPLKEGDDPTSIDLSDNINDFFFCPWCKARLDLKEDPDYTKIHFYQHMLDDLNQSLEEGGNKMIARRGYLVSLLPDPALRRLLEHRIRRNNSDIIHKKAREFQRSTPDFSDTFTQEYPSTVDKAEGAERAIQRGKTSKGF